MLPIFKAAKTSKIVRLGLKNKRIGNTMITTETIREVTRMLDEAAVPYEDWDFAFPEIIGFCHGQPIYWWKKGMPDRRFL